MWRAINVEDATREIYKRRVVASAAAAAHAVSSVTS